MICRDIDAANAVSGEKIAERLAEIGFTPLAVGAPQAAGAVREREQGSGVPVVENDKALPGCESCFHSNPQHYGGASGEKADAGGELPVIDKCHCEGKGKIVESYHRLRHVEIVDIGKWQLCGCISGAIDE